LIRSAADPDTARPRGPSTRHGLYALLWALFFLLLIHGAVRLARLQHLRPGGWPTDLYAFRMGDFGELDVAIIGTSRASFGLSPSAIDQCLHQELGHSTQTVNLARTALDAADGNQLARQLLRGEKLPSVLVLATSYEFFDNSAKRRLVNQKQTGSLLRTPSSLALVRSPADVLKALRPLTRDAEIAVRLASGGPSDAYTRWMMLHHGGGQFCFGSLECEEGNRQIVAQFPKRWRSAALKRIQRQQEARMEGIELGRGFAHEQLVSLLSWAQLRGVAVVLVDMPLHPYLREVVQPSVQQRYREYLLQLSADQDLTVLLPPTAGAFAAKESYVDPGHLNPRGSRLLSDQVCQTLLAPLLREDEG